MRAVLLAFLPIWVLTTLGWLTARTGTLGPGAEQVLGRFVFMVAMPALLFTTLLDTPLRAVLHEGIVAFGLSTLVICLAGMTVARLLHGRRRAGEQALAGMAAGYVNSANLGIPVAMQVLGNPSFMVSAALFQMLVVTPPILTALDHDRDERKGGRVRQALLLPVRTPIIAASVVAVLIASLGWTLPGEALQPLELLGGAAVPAALVSLGMSLHGRGAGVRTEPGEVGVLVGLKLVAQPVIAYVLAALVFGLEGPALLAVVLCAALPTAQNTYIFASSYSVGPGRARDAVLLSTLGSMVTLTAATYLLT